MLEHIVITLDEEKAKNGLSIKDMALLSCIENGLVSLDIQEIKQQLPTIKSPEKTLYKLIKK